MYITYTYIHSEQLLIINSVPWKVNCFGHTPWSVVNELFQLPIYLACCSNLVPEAGMPVSTTNKVPENLSEAPDS